MNIDDKLKIERLEKIISIYENKVFDVLYEKFYIVMYVKKF